MLKIIKYSLFLVIGIFVVLTAVIFLNPSVVLNRNNLVKLINTFNKSGTISYKEIDLYATSPSPLNKNIVFSAQKLCVKNDRLDLCMPEINLDITFAIGPEKIRITKIAGFVIKDGSMTLNIPRDVSSEKPQPEVSSDTSQRPDIKKSLIFRALELFSELSQKDIGEINIKNWSYLIDIKGNIFKGKVDIKNNNNQIVLKASSLLNGKKLDLAAEFGDKTDIRFSSGYRPILTFKTPVNAFSELVKYIQTKEIYRYGVGMLQAEISIKDIKSTLKLLDIDKPVGGYVNGKINLTMNAPVLDTAIIDLKLDGNIIDGGTSIMFSGDADYDLYQKIPSVNRLSIMSDAAQSKRIDDYASYRFLSYISGLLDCQFSYSGKNNDLKVIIKRDYSKLPRRIY